MTFRVGCDVPVAGAVGREFGRTQVALEGALSRVGANMVLEVALQ